jgi:hypothetical protein
MSVAELGFHEDFWVGSDTFFFNDFCLSNSLCAPKISASGIELGFEDYFWDNIFHQRFLSQQL